MKIDVVWYAIVIVLFQFVLVYCDFINDVSQVEEFQTNEHVTDDENQIEELQKNEHEDHMNMRNENYMVDQSNDDVNRGEKQRDDNHEQRDHIHDGVYNASCKHTNLRENRTTGRFSVKRKNKTNESIDPYLYFSNANNSDENNAPRFPEFWKYHAFLQEPLQSKIREESLTRHLMDQCMSTYYKMERNIDRACGEHEHDGYVNIERTVDVHARKHNQILESYKKQRCQQMNYVSAVSATVMCLTENTIRQKFIEHYADIASDNPVEGPVLYLKKLHEAMEKMSLCSQNEPDNTFPNLWRKFSKGQTYDPNAPFFVDDKKEVRLDIMHCNGADKFMTDETLRCSDTHLLDDKQVYKSIPGNNAYIRTKDYNCTQSAAYRYLVNETDSYPTLMDRKCKKVGSSVNDPDLTDKSLSSLYNSVHQEAFDGHTWERERDEYKRENRRPFTIAEAFVNSKGPLLDGFGIMYYCGHHACRANHRENPNDACFPKFKWEKDWSKVLHKLDNDFLASADILEQCINDGLLQPREILTDQRVYYANATIHRRSDLCISEEEIVQFLTKMYPSWVTEDDAISLVFGRHLAESLCFEERNKMCKIPESAYDALKVAVKALIDKCRSKRNVRVNNSTT